MHFKSTIILPDRQEDSLKSFRRGGSAVELQVAKTIGKNPPPKLRVERTKA